MSTPPRRLARPGSRKYAAILRAAEERFGELGFQKAGIDEIAASAGVSKPLIYRYFTSKKHLFEVVVERVISEWCDVISAEGARTTPDVAHTLRGVVRASLEFARSREVLRGLLARESQLMLAGYSDVLERGTQALRSVIIGALERGVSDGEVRTDVEIGHMSEVITEVCVGFGDRLLSGEVNQADSSLLEAIVETVLFGVIAKRTPGRTPG